MRDKLTDAQRTTLMLDLLAARVHGTELRGRREVHPKMAADRHVFLTEVADATGFARGFADALAVSLWKSDKFSCEGFELKASRGDLKREFTAPPKWKRIGQFCDRWTLVVWDRRWLEDERIPKEWGLCACEGGELVTVRKPTALTPVPWSPGFTAAVIRRAVEAAPSLALLERARAIGYSQGRYAGRDEVEAKVAKSLAPLLPAYRATEDGRWRHTVPIEYAVEQALAHVSPKEG